MGIIVGDFVLLAFLVASAMSWPMRILRVLRGSFHKEVERAAKLLKAAHFETTEYDQWVKSIDVCVEGIREEGLLIDSSHFPGQATAAPEDVR